MDDPLSIIGGCCILLLCFSFCNFILLCGILFHLNEWKWERKGKKFNSKGV